MTDWETFKQSTVTIRSEPIVLAGIQWRAETVVHSNQISVFLRVSHPTNQPQWYCKAEATLRWPRRRRSERVKVIDVFGSTSTTIRWQIEIKDVSVHLGINKNV